MLEVWEQSIVLVIRNHFANKATGTSFHNWPGDLLIYYYQEAGESEGTEPAC